MSKSKQRKNDVVQAAGSLFYQQGYYKTSIADIANQCGLKKASVYHYIGSKHELALDVVSSVQTYFDMNVFNHAYSDDSAPKERIINMFEAIEHYLDKYQQQYPMLALTLETNKEEDAVSTKLRHFFSTWIDALTHILSPAFEDQAGSIAEQVVYAVQGNLSLSKLYNRPLDLEFLKRHLLSLFR